MKPEHLITEVISKLREAGYSESTLEAYRVMYKHLLRYMEEHNLNEYTPAIGAQALPVMRMVRSCEKNKRQCGVVIRHLDSYIAGHPFRTPPGKRKREAISIYPEFDEYLEWCAVKGLAQSTINKRHYFVKRMADEFSALGLASINSLDMRLVIDFCNTLSSLSLSQKHDFVQVLKALLRFLFERGYISADFSQSVLNVPYSRDSRIPSYYTPDEVTLLLKAIGTNKPNQKRAYAAALIAARTGMRRSDIAGLKFSSIDWENDKIEITQHKTGEALCLTLLPDVGEAIADYLLNARPISDSEYIFLSHMPPFEPMKPGTLNYIIFSALDKAGIDMHSRKKGPHALRFSLASQMLASGESIKTIASALGHKNIQTTTMYAKVDISSLGRCALPVPEYRELSDFIIDERLETLIVGDLAPHIVDFITYKRAMGQKAANDVKHLSHLARFSLSYDLSEALLPQDMSERWLALRNNEKQKSQHDRRSVFTGFANYLHNLGYPVYIPEFVKSKVRSKFSPHIYSDEELKRFFSVTDYLETGPASVIANNRTLPATLFRVLLGCGLRVSEALNLKEQDVNFVDCTLRIMDSKNHKDRLVVMDESLCKSVKTYLEANKFVNGQHIFTKDNGNPITPSLVYNWFRKFIDKAGIRHNGKDYGPRVHDFRHTFAVRSLNKMLSEGKPLYVALPILKDYLGHYNIDATEQYVRLVEWMFPDVIAAMNSVSVQIVPDWGRLSEA